MGWKEHAVIVWGHVRLDNHVIKFQYLELGIPQPYQALQNVMHMKEKKLVFFPFSLFCFVFLLGQRLTTLEGLELK